MNQILDFGNGGNNDNNFNRKENKPPKPPKKEKNNYNSEIFSGNASYGNNKEKSPMSDKVVKVFAILMALFAVVLIFSGLTNMLKNKKDTKDAEAKAKNTVQQVEAEITAELDQISEMVKIKVNSPITISKIIYSWDKDHDNVIAGEKKNTLEKEIVAISGEHVLHIQVIDEENNKTTKDFTFNSATGVDTENPNITLTVTEDKKLLVTATDDTSIEYVTYKWNEEETITMKPEEVGSKKFEFELEIPRGKNTIVVFAVDGSESSNATSTSKVLEGVTKPEINYGFLDQEGAVLKIMCSHESGIKSIYYTLNGQPYEWKVAEGEEAPTYLEFTQDSVVGHNQMTITVTSVDDTVAEFNPAWDYGSAPAENDNGTENDSNAGGEEDLANATQTNQ